MKIVEANQVTKMYRNKKAIHNLSFAIEKNTITGLIGRNGAGKTTLLKMVAGFHKKTTGELTVFGEEPFNNIDISSNMIFVDDQMSFPQTFHLIDILEAASDFYKNWDMKLAKRLLEYFSLDPSQFHASLSKGMKSTFHMIIGIASRCELTIMDEPTTGMDAAVRKDFYRALLKDYLQHPRTILLSSHLLNEVEDLLEDVLLIDKGEKVLHMAVADLKEYAVGLRGPTEIVKSFTSGMETFYQEEIGKTSAYVVVKNDLSIELTEKAKELDIELTPVPTDDLCIYMTMKKKGGIDDVFYQG